MRGYLHVADGLNPYVNLATEELLLSAARPVLYLWQNEHSVILGRNQNAYTECNINFAREHGIHIARRLTGGGAVYHDTGNLNFSIILPRELHDIARSTQMMVRALTHLGVAALASGRNDILVDGKKISGNAYYSNDHVGLHHGTILYKVDTEMLQQVLNVAPNKVAKHGISSVRSRVTDLVSVAPQLTIPEVNAALQEAFCEEYGLAGLDAAPLDQSALAPLLARYSSDEWNLNRICEYDISEEETFSWGSVRVSVAFAGDTPQDVEVTSDSLDPDLIDEIRSSFKKHDIIRQKSSEFDDVLSVYQRIISGGKSDDS